MNLEIRALQLVEEALSIAPDEVADFLDRQCGEDAELRNYVKAILANSADADNLLRTSTNRADSTGPIGSSVRPDRLSPGQQQFPVGTILADRYKIEASIGVGGMGEVYRATDSWSPMLFARSCSRV